MVLAIDSSTIFSQSCPSCGRSHGHTVAIETTDESTTWALLGFFARCPVTGQRAWFVLDVPQRVDGRSMVVCVGPPDDDVTTPNHSLPTEAVRLPSARATFTVSSPRGTEPGGFRVNGRAPELLRLALGCPHTSRSLR
jgi:hypothetical protein